MLAGVFAGEAEWAFSRGAQTWMPEKNIQGTGFFLSCLNEKTQHASLRVFIPLDKMYVYGIHWGTFVSAYQINWDQSTGTYLCWIEDPSKLGQ